MKEFIRHEDEFYILATSPRVDDRTSVLKHGETFAVLDRHGEVDPFGEGELGLYHEGTRHLSRWTLRIAERRPFLLSSTVKKPNDLMAVDLTNHDLSSEGSVVLTRGSVHLFISIFLWRGACYERLRIRNYGTRPARLPLAFLFDADFCDVFEVRGGRRPRRGSRLPDEASAGSIVLGYRGLDGVVRRSRLAWNPAPHELDSGSASYDLELAPGDESEILAVVGCEVEDSPSTTLTHETARRGLEAELEAEAEESIRLSSSSEPFNEWVHRSQADLNMMLTDTAHGLYPYAGVPWFSTVFGRDGIITAFETLWVNPSIAAGVLRHLAATQAQERIPEQDAEPGKILHETRRGEMANLGEIPFGKYYGTVDATPLFLVLASAYAEWTGDLALIRETWPSIERALGWIDDWGDADGDGFVEYSKQAAHGLVHQGWKDSHDSVFHADGRDVTPPIALAEVQGYVYAAKRGTARLARRLGSDRLGEKLDSEADRLERRFEEAFWCEELGTYALALDGEKRPCRVKASNAGHCLLAGIASVERARRVAGTLLSDELFSGWGIRTLAASEARYNPMSYHNGSVWPHDNALIAAGLARYGFREETLRLFTGLMDAVKFVELQRLPELFCGFVRRPGEGPTLYPLACAPQSWASGSVFLLLQACLGMTIDGEKRQLRLDRPRLPRWLSRLDVDNLRVGREVVGLRFTRYARDVGVEITSRENDVDVVVVK